MCVECVLLSLTVAETVIDMCGCVEGLGISRVLSKREGGKPEVSAGFTGGFPVKKKKKPPNLHSFKSF